VDVEDLVEALLEPVLELFGEILVELARGLLRTSGALPKFPRILRKSQLAGRSV